MTKSTLLSARVNEPALDAADLICPLFVTRGKEISLPLRFLPPCEALSVDYLKERVGSLVKAGISSFLIYEVGASKDASGSFALSSESAVPEALKILRDNFPDSLLIADLCFCQYTDHGHCGVLKNGRLDNDASLNQLAELALIYAGAGAHALMPSGMLDGCVSTLRTALTEFGFEDTLIYNQSAKFCSGLYGPFRQATQHAEKDFDKIDYQLSPHNASQALREIELDEDEEADMVFIKPALMNVDLLYRASQESSVSIGAFCTSGEHALFFAGIDFQNNKETTAAVGKFMLYLERLKKAGASAIFSYAAPQVASYL